MPRSRPRRLVVDPFVRGLTGLPLTLAAIAMSLTGRAERAARLLARATDVRPAGRVLARSLLLLIPATLAFAAVAMQLFTAWSGYLYPLRPDTIAAIGHPFTPDRQVLPGAWGGPTLAGAWAVHSGVALLVQAACAALLIGLCTLEDRLMRWPTG